MTDTTLLVSPNDVATLTATANPGYEFANWVIPASPSGVYEVIGESNKARIEIKYLKSGGAVTSIMAVFRYAAYTVTFDPDDGSQPQVLLVTNHCTEVVKTPDVTRVGYTLTGWLPSAEKFSKISEDKPLTLISNETYLAQWKAKEYRVVVSNDTYCRTYVLSGSVTANKPLFDQLLTIKVQPRDIEGYNFSKTFVRVYPTGDPSTVIYSKSNETGEDLETDFVLDAGTGYYESITVEGGCEKEAITSTVDFDANGGSVSPTEKNVTYDEPYGTLPTPVREGHSFDGWYTATSGGSKIEAEMTVKIIKGQTLYAHWTAKTYKVKSQATGGEISVQETGTYGKPLYISWSGEAKTGYSVALTSMTVYAGEEPGGTVLTNYTKGTSATYLMEGGYFADIFIDGRFTFTPNTYTVNFNANGGNTPEPSFIIVTYDATYGELPTCSRTGYDFAGWWTDQTAGEQVTDETIVTITATQTLYAHWTAKTYAVQAVTTNCSLHVADIGVFDEVLPISWVLDVRDGYETKLASVQIKGGEDVAGELFGTFTSGTNTTFKLRDKKQYTTNIVITATATQTANKYTVTFDPQGGKVSETERIVTYDAEYGDLPMPMPSTSDNSFVGWYTEKDGGELIEAEALVKIAFNHTLYAHWRDGRNELTRAAHGRNVVLTTSGDAPFVAQTNEVDGTTVVKSGWKDADVDGKLTVMTMSGPGTLTFLWEKSNPDERYKIVAGGLNHSDFSTVIEQSQDFEHKGRYQEGLSEFQLTDQGDGWWQLSIVYAGDKADVQHLVTITAYSDAGGTPHTLWIDRVIWHPEGEVIEPTAEDKREFKAISFTGGELTLAFDPDERFGYRLRGTNDVVAPRPWPVLLTTNGVNTIILKPLIREGEQQMFYYLETIPKE